MSAREELVTKLCRILKCEDVDWEFKSIFSDGVIFRKRSGFIHHDKMSFDIGTDSNGTRYVRVEVDDNSDYGYSVGVFTEKEVIMLVEQYAKNYSDYDAERILKKI